MLSRRAAGAGRTPRGDILARRRYLRRVQTYPGKLGGADRSRRVARPAPFYRFFLVRRFFVVVGTIEKVDELLRAGNIGAGLTVVLTLTFPDGVNVVLVRMRMVPPDVG